MQNPQEGADRFLREAHDFHLGKLPTEQPNPRTTDLSELAKNNLLAAIDVLKEVDLEALGKMRAAAPGIEQLHRVIRAVINKGHNVFLCGCGATGRLSLSLEVLWREIVPKTYRERVTSFMAGGDLALIRSIENFEDLPAYGARQLAELGFKEGDLLVSCTEGGETPFVIGATEHAVTLSQEPPWFLYCNPDDILSAVAERSRRVISNDKITKLNLYAGPMGLSGSTRMQASTVLMYAVGLALLNFEREALDAEGSIVTFAKRVRATPHELLRPFIEAESTHYRQHGYTTYETSHYGITILTDTTERSPTFSLRGFENLNDENASPALCYLSIPGSETATLAFQNILHRAPRTLEWPEVQSVAGAARLSGFDFSERGRGRRQRLIGDSPLQIMRIDRKGSQIEWNWGQSLQSVFECSTLSLLEEHLLLKMLLNIHSTLVMGRLERYEHNLMTWVRPSNKKLIDRAIRYIDILLQQKDGKTFSYEKIARTLFEVIPTLQDDEPIVMKVWQKLRALSE